MRFLSICALLLASPTQSETQLHVIGLILILLLDMTNNYFDVNNIKIS